MHSGERDLIAVESIARDETLLDVQDTQHAVALADDRIPAKRARSGDILAWSTPSLLSSAASLAEVLMNAPMSEVQHLADRTCEVKYRCAPEEQEEGVRKRENKVGRQQEQGLPADTADSARSPATSGLPCSSTTPAPSDDYLYPSEEGPFPKRSAIPVLQFLNASGNDVTADSDPARVASARPQPGSSLRLDKLLAAGVDVISQVWTATVLPKRYRVLVKLFTDQRDKMQPDVYVPPEVYEPDANNTEWSKPSLGSNAQWSLSLERDCFLSMARIQGSYVPYSFGYYPVSTVAARWRDYTGNPVVVIVLTLHS